MRYGFGLFAAALTLAWLAASALPAQTESKKIQVAPGAVAETTKLVRPQALAQQSTAPRASALTADQCKELGGEVVYDDTHSCGFGLFYCKATDNYGQVHRVCLESIK